MTEAELEELIADCPILYHMAEAGSWPSIAKHGLLSTSALLDLWGVPPDERRDVEEKRRPEKVILDHPQLGRAVIRDNRPMDDSGLRRCLLDGLSPSDWYKILNGRVFFWLTRDRLLRLLGAAAYAASAHDVLELDTQSLVAAHRRDITLSPINSGATRPIARSRGLDTFKTIAEYPYQHWRPRRRRGERVVELAVSPGVPDIAKHVRRVTRMKGPSELSLVYSAT